jgi:hypothetical protein
MGYLRFDCTHYNNAVIQGESHPWHPVIIFISIKKELGRKQFDTDKELKHAVRAIKNKEYTKCVCG